MPEIPEIGGRNFLPELVFTASRSSGPGGQHVNKVSTRIELRFNVPGSQLLNTGEKAMLLEKLGNRISKEGNLLLVSQSERSQLENRNKVLERFARLLTKALEPPKARRATKPSRAARMKRLEKKRNQADKKARRKPAWEE
jgi:ribosome-associated protein